MQKNILFVHYGSKAIRGSEICLLNLLKYLDRDLFTPILWCNTVEMAQEARKLSVLAFVSDFPLLLCGDTHVRSISQWYKTVRDGLNMVDQFDIDLIHANSGAPNQWMNSVSRIKNKPLISHLHARYPLKERFALHLLNPSLTVGVSSPVINQLLKDGVSKEYLRVIHNGIDVAYQDNVKPIDVRELLAINKSSFVLMTIGSLIQRKGMDIIIKAMRHLKNWQIDAHLIIAGDGPEMRTLKTLVKVNLLIDNIHFLGETKQVPELLRGGIDIFVSGAREEVFGLVLAEANLASVAVIVTKVGGIPEVIQDGVTGLLVPPENDLEMAEAMERLIKSPNIRNSLAIEGRKYVLEKFHIKTNVLQFETLYKHVLSHSKYNLHWFSSWHIPQLIGMGIRSIRLLVKPISLPLKRYFIKNTAAMRGM